MARGKRTVATRAKHGDVMRSPLCVLHSIRRSKCAIRVTTNTKQSRALDASLTSAWRGPLPPATGAQSFGLHTAAPPRKSDRPTIIVGVIATTDIHAHGVSCIESGHNNHRQEQPTLVACQRKNFDSGIVHGGQTGKGLFRVS